MIKDSALLMSDAQTGITTSAASTSTIDLSKRGDALDGSQLYWVCRVQTAMDSANHTATLSVGLETADDSAFSTNKTVLMQTAATVVTSLTAGTVIAKAIVPTGCRQYVRTYYTNAVEAFNAGALDSFLVADVDILLTTY